MGSGVDPLNGVSYNTPFEYLDGEGVPTTIQPMDDFELIYDAVSTSASLGKFLDFSMAADVSGWGQSASASFGFLSQIQTDSTSANFVLHKAVQGHKERFDVHNPNIVLKASAREDLQNDPQLFIDRYGPLLVASKTYGCVFDGVVTIQTSNRNEARRISAQVGGSWKAFGASGTVNASLASELAKSNSEKRISARYAAKGYANLGAGSAWTDPEDVQGMFALANEACANTTALGVSTTNWSEVTEIEDVLYDSGKMADFLRILDQRLAAVSKSEEAHHARRAEQLRAEFEENGLYGASTAAALEALREEIETYLAALAAEGALLNAKGKDLIRKVEILIEEAARGTTKSLSEPKDHWEGAVNDEARIDLPEGYVMVGVAVGVSKSNVNALLVQGRRMRLDGTLESPKEFVGSGGYVEASCDAPEGHVIVGVGGHVENNNFDTLHIWTREYDATGGRLLGQAQLKKCGKAPNHGLERTFLAPEFAEPGAEDRTIMAGISMGVHDSNLTAIRGRLRKIETTLAD